jgi:hypothetical protein
MLTLLNSHQHGQRLVNPARADPSKYSCYKPDGARSPVLSLRYDHQNPGDVVLVGNYSLGFLNTSSLLTPIPGHASDKHQARWYKGISVHPYPNELNRAMAFYSQIWGNMNFWVNGSPAGSISYRTIGTSQMNGRFFSVFLSQIFVNIILLLQLIPSRLVGLSLCSSRAPPPPGPTALC